MKVLTKNYGLKWALRSNRFRPWSVPIRRKEKIKKLFNYAVTDVHLE